MQRLLALQMKQTNVLMQRMAPKHQDALTSALGGGGSESGSSSGVRRLCCKRAVCQTLGGFKCGCKSSSGQRPAGAGSADFSHLWGSDARLHREEDPSGRHEASDLCGDALCSRVGSCIRSKRRGLLFIEQCAMDGGKTQFAWLLTGLPEPNWSITTVNRRRQSLQPFSRLAQPAWACEIWISSRRNFEQQEARPMPRQKILRRKSPTRTNQCGRKRRTRMPKAGPKSPREAEAQPTSHYEQPFGN